MRPLVGELAQAWIGAPIKAAAMVRIAENQAWTLEEGGPNVAVWRRNVVFMRLERDGEIDPLDEEEDGDQKEEGGGVMVRCLGEQEDCYRDDGSEEGECLPAANFGGPHHPLIECIPPACIGLLTEYYHSHAKVPPPPLQPTDDFAVGGVRFAVPRP